MATETKQKSQVRINPLLSEQSEYALGDARALYDSRKGSPIPSLYTGISSQQQAGLDRTWDLASGGAGMRIAQPAIDEYQATLRGDYLNANPYLDEIVRRSGDAAASGVASQFAGSGRFGSGVMANAVQDAMQSTAANIYGQNYQQERNRMMAMLDRGQQINDMQYADANRMRGVGAAYEEDQTRMASEQMRQYQAEIDHLKTFLQMLQGNPLMGEKTMKSETTALDYGAMAAGGAKFLQGMTGAGSGGAGGG